MLLTLINKTLVLSCIWFSVSRQTDADSYGPLASFLDESYESILSSLHTSEAILITGEIHIYFSEQLWSTTCYFSFHQIVVTHDLIPSCRIVVYDLTVSPITSAMSDHFHIKFELTTCPPSGFANANPQNKHKVKDAYVSVCQNNSEQNTTHTLYRK